MDQKSKEPPQPATAIVQTDSPTPISLNGLWLQSRTPKIIHDMDEGLQLPDFGVSKQPKEINNTDD